MDSQQTEYELHRDFRRWTQLVDDAAHAENEVDRELPALRAAALKQKWINTASELWRTLQELHEQWFDTVDPTSTRATAETHGPALSR